MCYADGIDGIRKELTFFLYTAYHSDICLIVNSDSDIKSVVNKKEDNKSCTYRGMWRAHRWGVLGLRRKSLEQKIEICLIRSIL